MSYLSDKKVVHGDLALRNVLLENRSGNVKICDFGLAKNVYKYGEYRKRGSVKVPVRWMAPEALKFGTYSLYSDVWSYGITLWELFSLGAIPYHDLDVNDLINSLMSQNLEFCRRPDYMPESIYKIVSKTWNYDPYQRPEFEIIAHQLNNFVDNYYKSVNTASPAVLGDLITLKTPSYNNTNFFQSMSNNVVAENLEYFYNNRPNSRNSPNDSN